MNPATSKQRPLALITGASAGIGAEFARQLAARGYDLALTARREERLTNLAGTLTAEHGARCQVIAADLQNRQAPRQIMAAISGEGRAVDLLVNNAGYATPGYYTRTGWETHQAFLTVMVDAVSELAWRALPAMQEARRGGIINVASLAGLVPGSAGHTLYAAVKAYMVAFSESLAMENTGYNLRIQALCPGFTYSEFHDVVGTRDIVSEMPQYMWMAAEDVVRISLDRYESPRSPVVVVPGRFNRFVATLARKLPYSAAFGLVKRRSGTFRRQE